MPVTFTHKRQKLASLNQMPQSINSGTCEDPPTVLLYRDRNKAALVKWLGASLPGRTEGDESVSTTNSCQGGSPAVTNTDSCLTSQEGLEAPSG